MGDLPKIHQEIPIRSFSISAYIACVEDGEGRSLFLRRLPKYHEGTRQQISRDVQVVLSAEHSDYRWVATRDAHKFLMFSQQIATVEHLEEAFVRDTPPEFLRIRAMG